MVGKMPDLETEWYFAIASMMNKVSLNGRGLYAIESKPAEIQDHELIFYGPMGIAAAIPAEGKTFHGVLHKLTKEDMARLDQIEVSVTRSPAKARLYDGTLIDCAVYCEDPEKKKAASGGEDRPPEQRYIDIMIEGCKMYGVSEEYIAKLGRMETRPRLDPKDFATFKVPENAPTMTAEEVAKADGADADGKKNPKYFSVNGKVIECLEGCPPQMAAMWKGDITLQNAKAKYDPKYGMPEKLEDMTAEHKAASEHLIADNIKEGKPLAGKLKCVALLK